MFVRSDDKQSRLPRQRADASRLRSHNATLLLNLIWREPQPSRADLARLSGLSRSTVSGIVTELISTGLVLESHVAPSNGGRPPIALRTADERFHLLGVELGASHITAVRTDLRGRIIETAHAHHDVQIDPDGSMAIMGDMVEGLIDPDTSGVAIGLAVPSPLDPKRPGRLSERILPAWTGWRPAELLQARTGLPVFMDNDANLGALAEHWWGVGQGIGEFAYLKLGTGVGAGLILDGEIYRGAFGIAGEIGHTAIDPNGPRCRCGLTGCLEAMVGAQSLVARAQKALTKDIPDLQSLLLDAMSGDNDARALVSEAGRYLGIAVANLVNLVNPGMVVLGGQLPSAGEILFSPLLSAMQERSLSTSWESAEVRPSALGREAVALGAATLVLQAALADPTLFPATRTLPLSS